MKITKAQLKQMKSKNLYRNYKMSYAPTQECWLRSAVNKP